MKPRAHLAYKLTFLDKEASVATGLPVGFPVQHWRDGSLCEPIVAYACWRHREQRAKVTSLQAEAYVLREWVSACATAGASVCEHDKLALRHWAELQAAQPGSSDNRTEWKLRVVQCFHGSLHHALAWEPDGERRLPVAVPSTMIVRKRVRKRRYTQRDTPNAEEVQTVMERIQTPREGPGRNGGDPSVPELCAGRNHVMARMQSVVGLRGASACDLTMSALWECIREEDILPRDLRGQGWKILDVVARDSVLYAGVRDAFGRFPTEFLFGIRIIAKGGRAALAGCPPELTRDLLCEAVFNVRRRQLEYWAKRGRHVQPNFIFLSWKTRDRLLPKALAGTLAKAFSQEPAVKGSPHRLRAYSITMRAIEIWRDCLLRFGGEGSTAENAAMQMLADDYGHADSRTTLRHYLSLAQIIPRRVLIGTEEVNELFALLADRRYSISRQRAALATRFLSVEVSGEDEEVLHGAIEMLMQRVQGLPSTA